MEHDSKERQHAATELPQHHLLDLHSNDVAPPGMFEEEIDDEMPPLQYARLIGLARDHLADQLVFSELAKLQRPVQRGLTDDIELQRFDFGKELNVEERVTISKEGAQLLSSIVQQETAEGIDAMMLPMLWTGRLIKSARIELPLLRTNHEADYKSFARRDDFEIKLCDIKFPLEMVNEEKNEGLLWPTRFSCLGVETLEQLKQERFSVSKDDLVYLQDTLKCSWTEEDAEALWGGEQKYKRRPVLEPVTPPLSPLPTPLEPYEPSMSDPAFQLPILSDASSPTKYVLEALEQKIFEQDVPTPLRKTVVTAKLDESSSDTYPHDPPITLGELYSPLASLEGSRTPPSIEMQRRKREDLKVEEPLTPEMPQVPPKSVHFSDIVEEMKLYPASEANSPAYETKFFEEAFGDALRTANHQTEQERLIEADSAARVDVPLMDFSKPEPPWKAFEQQRGSPSLLNLQILMIQSLIGQPKLWPGSEQVATKLKWVPFPASLAKVALEEPVKDNDDTWKVFVEDATELEVINSSNLTWKPPGLKILYDEDDDEDEIEIGTFLKENAQDLSALIKKRKLELDLSGNQDNKTLTKAFATADKAMQRNAPNTNKLVQPEQNMQGDSSQGLEFGLLGGTFSAANSIDNYLELRGTKKPKLTDSSYFPSVPPAVQARVKCRTPQADLRAAISIQLPIRKSPLAKPNCLPTPSFQPPTAKTYIIVASTLLRQRTLVKYLETLFPGGLKLIERDFSAHNTTIWMAGSVTRSPIKCPLDSEADIIVSPSMGVVITTLQKIKQKPLPGQKSKTAIRERLEHVSARYGKLAVYISEGSADESTNGLDASDCIELASFTGFALGLNSSTIVQFIGGGEETLSKWLAGTITQNQVIGDSAPIEEETHWELFLRRAGMNAFAAQAILADLKEPEGVDPRSPSKAGLFGLTAFVEMAVEQRITRFGPLCGRGVIERASAVIDTEWQI